MAAHTEMSMLAFIHVQSFLIQEWLYVELWAYFEGDSTNV